MITQFALRLICGMSLMWAAMPRRDVTSGFFRIQMLVVMGLAVLAGLTGKYDADAIGISARLAFAVLAGVLALLAYCGSIIWTLGRRKSGAAVVFAIAALSTIMLVLLTLEIRRVGDDTIAPANSHPITIVIGEIASSLLLGATVTGMLLGHWYLTAPTMSIAPLSRLNSFLFAAAVARFALSGIALGIGTGQLVGLTHLTWLALRWSAGIIGPLGVAVMVWRILKYRNTQAATGVLFVGVILTFIGEMTAVLLLRETGIPF